MLSMVITPATSRPALNLVTFCRRRPLNIRPHTTTELYHSTTYCLYVE